MTHAPGDPGHIDVHNQLVADVALQARRRSVDVVLPDDAVLGDTGHVDDHNLIVEALRVIAESPGGGMTWARVSGGTVTTYTRPDGSVMEVHTFTADGSLTVDTPGFADVLLVAAGAGGTSQVSEGAGGSVVNGAFALPAGAIPVTVGTFTSADPNQRSGMSVLGSVAFAGGVRGGDGGASRGTSANGRDGVTSGITGADKYVGWLYATADANPANQIAPTPNSGAGWGQGTGTGGSGVVIVAVQKSAPTVSGVVASGTR